MADVIPGYGKLLVSERMIDATVESARVRQALRGYPPGRVEDWFYSHRFEFVREDPFFTGVGTQSFTINVGGCSAFEWLGVGFNAVVDDSQDPATGEFWSHDPGETCDLSFYSINGTRPHQSEPVQGSMFWGGGFHSILFESFQLPYYFDEPQMLPPNDTIRCEIVNRRTADDAAPPNNVVTYLVNLFGIRWYAKRT